MRHDHHTTTPDAAAAWECANFPAYEPDVPTLAELDHGEPGPGEPGPFADAFRKSVAEVARIRGAR